MTYDYHIAELNESELSRLGKLGWKVVPGVAIDDRVLMELKIEEPAKPEVRVTGFGSPFG